MAKDLRKGDRGPEVKKLQAALNEVGAKPKLKEDSQFGTATEEAVKAFQKQNGLKSDGIAGRGTMQKISKDGGAKDSQKSASDSKGGAENIKGGASILDKVDSGLKKKVLAFAEKYGQPITITSGVRTLTKQAELMVEMSDKDLGMYGKGNYVDEIKALKGKERTVAKVEEILAKWKKKGSFISRHLQGKAIDIDAGSGFNWAKAKKAANEAGLTVKEEEGRGCFHVQL